MAHICNHCEDHTNPVIPESGISVAYTVVDDLQIDVHLHRECAEAWSRDFGIPLSARAKAGGQDQA